MKKKKSQYLQTVTVRGFSDTLTSQEALCFPPDRWGGTGSCLTSLPRRSGGRTARLAGPHPAAWNGLWCTLLQDANRLMLSRMSREQSLAPVASTLPTCQCILQVTEVWCCGDGELQLLRGAVGVWRLQMFGGDEDAVTSGAQVHHGARAPPGGQGRRWPVHQLHLSTAGHFHRQTFRAPTTLFHSQDSTSWGLQLKLIKTSSDLGSIFPFYPLN